MKTSEFHCLWLSKIYFRKNPNIKLNKLRTEESFVCFSEPSNPGEPNAYAITVISNLMEHISTRMTFCGTRVHSCVKVWPQMPLLYKCPSSGHYKLWMTVYSIPLRVQFTFNEHCRPELNLKIWTVNQILNARICSLSWISLILAFKFKCSKMNI